MIVLTAIQRELLTELLKHRRLTKELATCDDRITALTNQLAVLEEAMRLKPAPTPPASQTGSGEHNIAPDPPDAGETGDAAGSQGQ